MKKEELNNLVKRIEKNLYRVANELKNIGETQKLIVSIYRDIDVVEAAVSEDLGIRKHFREQMKGRDVPILVKKLSRGIQALREFVDENEEIAWRAKSFLEKEYLKSMKEWISSFSFFIKTVAPLGSPTFLTTGFLCVLRKHLIFPRNSDIFMKQ